MKPGITFHKHSADFAVHSTAQKMTLLLFDAPDAKTPSREVPMNRNQRSTDSAGGYTAPQKIRSQESIFHVHVPHIQHGQSYLYEADGQWVLDPCAHTLYTPRRWGDKIETGNWKRGTSPPELRTLSSELFPKCAVIDDSFDWKNDAPPRTPLENTIIYEAHLRGFTKSESDGSYLDFIGKIPYLQELGITAVEFLPLFEFDELEFFLRGDARQELVNFWGYSTLGFFAPMSRYASSPEPGVAVSEFKTLVKALHAAGIEVILDVVFNHTGEGEKEDATRHFRALDEDAYYLKEPDGSYQNWTGCGNTVNANHLVTRQFIVESLKYWITEMHVDGFRFDLATSLCRGENGELLEKPPLLHTMEKEPALKDTKLIAEAWDLGTYQVGHYPGKRFCDWNGKYRDDVRRFWNRDQSVANLATRLSGSSDLYGHKESGPLHSINFITSHDGFTLADLVSYEKKHNEANGEENRDGEEHNQSVNFGVEGPTDDPAIKARRLQQQKNLLATLLLSQGVPMLTAGDEFGRTQQGNNNAYCQDNNISWIDWSLLEKNRELFDFTKQLIALRKAHSGLRRKKHLTENDVTWFSPDGSPPDWQNARALGMHLTRPGREAGRGRIDGPPPPEKDLLILINNEQQDVEFNNLDSWSLELSTAPTDGFTLPPHSLAIYKK